MTEPPPAARNDSLVAAGNKFMIGGSSAAAAATLVGALVVWPIVSGRAAIACVTGGALALLTLALAQAILTATHKLKPGVSMAVAMGAYALTVGCAFGAYLLLKRQEWLPGFWIGMGILMGASGYVLGVAITWPRLRVLVFDPSPPPADEQP